MKNWKWLEMTGEDKLLPFELSGGMRKHVGLASALVMEPELILFDGPTQGLDPVIGALIDELITDLTKRTKTTSIIVTHLMDSAFHVVTRMAVEKSSNKECPSTCGNQRTRWSYNS
jgi:phospholipid/cholesterol/gamma-HCH transport system ATP-binding protein